METKDAKLFIETVPKPQPVKMQKKTLERRSQNVWKFLEAHDCINFSCLAASVKYNQGNLDRYRRNKKKLPEHLLLKIEEVLEKYGLFGYIKK